MKAVPLYQARNLTPAYALRYSWTAFPSGSSQFSQQPPADLLAGLRPLWESDGLRLLEHRWTGQQIQAVYSTKPNVAPAFLAARAKGRLQHAMRAAGHPVRFARNFAIRAIGNNTRETVEHYISAQVANGGFADPGYRAHIKESTWTDPSVDLAAHTSTSSGRYWYNLHIVMVTSQRYRIDAATTATVLSETCHATATKHGYLISALSVMPDHLHLILRGVPEQSPEDIVLAFQNNTAWKLGQVTIWEHNYYAGTVGEYTMRATRDRD